MRTGGGHGERGGGTAGGHGEGTEAGHDAAPLDGAGTPHRGFIPIGGTTGTDSDFPVRESAVRDGFAPVDSASTHVFTAYAPDGPQDTRLICQELLLKLGETE
nr:hypothetical protein KPHV_76900 [Kitasatospora purpeofusca]